MYRKIGIPTLYRIALFILVLYLSPLLILGQDSHLQIHDGLIAKHDILKVLAESGQIFGARNSVIQAPLNGIPRAMIGYSEFSIALWLTYFFGAFPALVIHKIILHSVAFIGMYRLLIRHFLGVDREMKILSLGVALGFAVLPYWEYAGLGIVAQPLALDMFLTIRRGENHWVSWLVLALIPFYSSLYYAFSWFLVFVGLLWGYDLLFKRQFNGKFLGSIFLMGSVYMLVEYQIVYGIFFNSGPPSIREDFGAGVVKDPMTLYSVFQIIKAALQTSAFGRPVAQSLHIFFIIPAAIIGIFILFDKKIKDSRILFAIALIFVCGLIYQTFQYIGGLPGPKIFIDAYAFTVQPMLWFIVFALSLKLIVRYSGRGVPLASALIFLQVFLGFFYHSEIQSSRQPSYRELFSVDLFKQIENYIDRPQSEYRVISIGLHPGISYYNGFYTLDGYHTNYPLEHKKNFREIIAPELMKNKRAQVYFDSWGGRCYVFVSELEFTDWLYTKNQNGVVQHLDLNMSAFVEMGGEYIFSAVEIKNYEENQLDLERVFEDNNSPWRIYLYKAKEVKSQPKST